MNRRILLVVTVLLIVSSLFSLPINVSIVGSVDNPGVYVFDSNNRLSQAVQFIELSSLQSIGSELQSDKAEMLVDVENNQQLSGSLKADMIAETNMKKIEGLEQARELKSTLGQEEYIIPEISYRKVVLIRNGEEKEINLLNFFLTGSLENNPYLLNEDVIKLFPVERSVQIQGAVNKAGTIEFVEGERLSDAVKYAFGFKLSADISHVLVDRYSEDGSLTKIYVDYTAVKENIDSEQNIKLQHNDKISVFEKTFYIEEKIAEVRGLVKYPGEYAIDDNSTLLDVLTQAGGPLKSADLNFAILIDKNVADTFDPDLERLMSLNMALMSSSEYSYYQSKLREISGKHYVNIKKLWETKDEKYNRPLNNGDIIIIKEAVLTVNISGAVFNAGLQPWEEGKTWEEYVTSAGGLIPSAYESKAKVIRYQSGVWIDLEDDTPIYPGDEVFIPEHKDRTTWDYVVEGLAITAQVMTIILGVHTLTK